MHHEKETEVVRLCLNGSSLQTICKRLDIDAHDVRKILLANPVTNEFTRKELERLESRGFSNFYRESEYGRPKKAEEDKRKPKQFRISDNELAELGNPSTTEIRRRLFRLKQIEDLCDVLDEKGIKLLPDEWLEQEYNKSDPFWQNGIYSKNWSKLTAVATSKRIQDNLGAE